MYSKHACVTISSLLDHLLADGTKLEFMQDHAGVRNSDGLNGTPAADELLRDMIRDNGSETKKLFIWLHSLVV